jgi:membrane protein DedA with SNARE-associated domain
MRGLLLPFLILGLNIDPAGWIADYGYPAVFIIIFLETAGIPLPGEATLLLAGVAAGGGHLDLSILIPVAILAAILGDNVGYLIGRVGGRRIVLRLARYGRVGSMLAWGERFFERHGGKTVFLARWTAGLRIFGAWIAGMTHMPYGRFFLWNALGGITWATTVILLGYAFSGSIHKIESILGTGGAITAAIVLGGGLLYSARLLHRRQQAARERDEAEAAAAADAPTDPA